jgi:hypothetical protein
MQWLENEHRGGKKGKNNFQEGVSRRKLRRKER